MPPYVRSGHPLALCTGGGRADVGIGPYEKTGSEAVGAAFMAARAAESDAPTPSAVSPDA